MNRRLPPLNALRAFDIAARTRSFTAAASALHVSQGAVSRHVALLEAYLGVPLFRRDPSGAQLTTAGAEYARAIGQAFDAMEQATRSAADRGRDRPLRIKLFPSVAIKWLISRLAAFHAEHPGVEVSLTTTPKLVQFDPQEDDLTIQIGNMPQVGVRYDPLIRVELVPVCSPDYRQRCPIGSADDLCGQLLLSSVQRPNDWPNWLRRAGVEEERVRQEARTGMRFGNSALMYQAAIDGMGVAIAQRELVRDDLGAGRLVLAHDLLVVSSEIYYLASAADAAEGSDVAAFRRWILGRGNIRADFDRAA